jgi:hypothetical protein
MISEQRHDHTLTLCFKAKDPLQTAAGIGATIDVISQKDDNVVAGDGSHDLSQQIRQR